MNSPQNVLIRRLATLLTCTGLCAGLMAIVSGCEDQNAGIADSGGSGGSGGSGKTGEAKSVVVPPSEEEIRKRYEALIEEYHPKFLTEEPNAWPQLAAIVQEFEDKYGLGSHRRGLPPRADFTYVFTGSKDVTRSEFELALEQLESARAEGFFARTGALVGKQKFVRPAPPRPIVGDAFADVVQARNLGRAQVARMAVAFSKNDFKDAAMAFEELLLLGNALTYLATTEARFSGSGMIQAAMSAVRDELSRRELPLVFLDRIKRATLDFQGMYPPLQLTLRGEELRVLDTAAYLTGPEGKGGKATAMQKAALKPDYMFKALVSFPSYKEIAAISDQHFALLNDYVTKQRAEQLAIGDPLKVMRPLSNDAYVVVALAPPGILVEAERDVELKIASLLVMLAIEEYRAKMGKLPTTLSELVPSYLSTLPRDPFGIHEMDGSDEGTESSVSSRVGGNELMYRVTTDGQDAASNAAANIFPRGYILYSVGADGIDDGGKTDPNPFRSITRINFGFDMVLTESPKYRPAILRRDELKDPADSVEGN